MTNTARSVFLFSIFALMSSGHAADQTSSFPLKYKITVEPPQLTINRMPSVSPRQYSELITFVVTNYTKLEYKVKSPPCKAFKFAIYRVDAEVKTHILDLPIGLYCEAPSTIQIPGAGGTWKRAQSWIFGASDLPDGDYLAVGTFLPTEDSSASASFHISSTN